MHIPVLLEEIISGLDLSRFKSGTVIDATLNNGGHTKALLERHPNISVIGFDLDSDALTRAKMALTDFEKRVTFVHASYEAMKLHIRADTSIIGVIFDFGLSSEQLDSARRGFSFRYDEPLDMRFNQSSDAITAYDVVNTWSKETLIAIIRHFGEERYARRIAHAIVAHRAVTPIETTQALVTLIQEAVPASYRNGHVHPATRTFQAIRIAVNRELDVVEKGLHVAWDVLKPQGRIAAISFHSLEDRIVKRLFQEKRTMGEGMLITKKPIMAGEDELDVNPRARSAKLRILEKIN